MLEQFNLDAKFSLFSDHWRPKVVAMLNGQEVKLVTVLGAFAWHHSRGGRRVLPGVARPVSQSSFATASLN
jgi:hypothetical protein